MKLAMQLSAASLALALLPCLSRAAEQESAPVAAPAPSSVAAPASSNAATSPRTLVFTAGAPIEPGTRFFKVGGGTGSLSFELLNADGTKPATLPEGMSFGADGVVSGAVPESATTTPEMTYTVRIKDQGGGALLTKVGLRINPSLVAALEPIRLTAGGTISPPIVPYKVTGGTGAVRVSYVNPNGAAMPAPAGLRFGADGSISGKVPSEAGAVEGMKALFVDQGGGRVIKDVVWVINRPLQLSTADVLVTAGGSLIDPLQIAKVEGGTGSIRYTLLSSETGRADLPEGLSFNDVTGTLSGQVRSAASTERKFTVRATDQGGGVAEGTVTLRVNKPIEILAN